MCLARRKQTRLVGARTDAIGKDDRRVIDLSHKSIEFIYAIYSSIHPSVHQSISSVHCIANSYPMDPLDR